MDNFDEIFYYKPDVLVDILDEAIENCSKAKDLLELAVEEEKKENTAKEKRIEELKQEIAPALELALKIQSKKFCSLLRSGKTKISYNSICDIFKSAVKSVEDILGDNRLMLSYCRNPYYSVPENRWVVSYEDFSFFCEEDIPTFRHSVEGLEDTVANFYFNPLSKTIGSCFTHTKTNEVLDLIDSVDDEDRSFELGVGIHLSSSIFLSSECMW